MPKHVPNYRHLVASSWNHTQDAGAAERTWTVSEILARSRAQSLADRERQAPPHLHGERVWRPEQGGSTGLLDAEDGGIHPAELLRRSQVSRRQAERSVAGPAPPPSWRASSSSPASTTQSPKAEVVRGGSVVTTAELIGSANLFQHAPLLDRPGTGAAKLVEHCLGTVLRYFEKDQSISLPPPRGDERDPHQYGNEAIATFTCGEVLQEQVLYLDPHLRTLIVEFASYQPENSPLRLTSRSLRLILGLAGTDTQYGVISAGQSTENVGPIADNSEESWDEPWSPASLSAATQSLSLTSNRTPLSILRALPSSPFVSLTSLNLAYSTVPTDLARLAAVLPASLRDLGLVGVRISGSEAGSTGTLRRGLAAIARKLLVLRMLDLSHPNFEITSLHLTSLLSPPEKRLPSLRLLGLRGVLTDSEAREAGVGAKQRDGLSQGGPSHPSSTSDLDTLSKEEKRKLLEVIRGGGRQRYIEVVWH